MVDPLTALMYAVQVMNFLKTLIEKTIREREDSVVETCPVSRVEPSSDEDGHQSSSQSYVQEGKEDANKGNEEEKVFVVDEPAIESPHNSSPDETTTGSGSQSFLSSIENIILGGNRSLVDNCPCEVTSQVSSLMNGVQDGGHTSVGGEAQTNTSKSKTDQSSSSNMKKGCKKTSEQLIVHSVRAAEKTRKTRIMGRMNSRKELVEAWR